MGRYLRLYGRFLEFSFSKALQFRLDFYFRIGMDVLWYAVNIAFFEVLYLHTDLVGGWSHAQVHVFLGAIFLVDAIHMTVFSNNMWWFPISVNRGDLDYYLVRPVSPLFFMSLREFAANSFVNLLIAIGIFVWMLVRYPEPLTPAACAAYVLLLLVGVLIHYCLHMLFLIPVFWLHTTHGIREIFYALDRYTTRPDGIYRGFLRRMLLSFLPFALIASYPTRALFEGFPAALVLHVLGVAVAAFVVLVLFWRVGLRAYASASS